MELEPIAGNSMDVDSPQMEDEQSEPANHLTNLLRSDDVDAKDKTGPTSLHNAAAVADYKIAESLISFGADIDSAEKSPLHVATENGSEEIVALLLKHGANLNLEDNVGDTALHKAARLGHYNIAVMLLEKGAKIINSDYEKQSTPLHLASREGHEKIVAVLLKFGAPVNSVDHSDETPLYLAARNGHFSIAVLLLAHGAHTIISECELYFSPLHLAAKGGHLKVVNLLLQHGASVHCDAWKTSPLSLACENGHHEVVALFLEKGAFTPNLQYDGPLFCAVNNGHHTIVDMLVKHGADLNFRHYKGDTPLCIACRRGYLNIAISFLKSGVKIENRDGEQSTPLNLAAGNGYEELVELLLNHGASTETKDVYNRKPLYLAAGKGHCAVAAQLLASGACVNSESIPRYINENSPITPLDFAANCNHRDVVELLLNHGANIVNSVTTSLQASSLEICGDLLMAGANVNAKDTYGSTGLHYALCPKIVDFLVAQGADINTKNHEGMSPLLSACGSYLPEEVLIAMLKNGSDIHCSDHLGRTSLHVASESLHAGEKIKVLLKWGAEIHSRDNNGNTPLHLASKRHNDNVVGILLENGADINLMRNENTILNYMKIKFNRYENLRCVIAPMISYLENYIMMMRSLNMYLCPELLEDVKVKELGEEYLEELARLKVTCIGNSGLTYYKFTQKSEEQLVSSLGNEEILGVLESGSYREEFRHFVVLISRQFNKGNGRKTLVDKVKRSCSVVFVGLLEECVENILSYFSNDELSVFAGSFAEVGGKNAS